MLRTRVLTALVLLPLILAALFRFPPIAWAGFTALIAGLALWEYARMAGMQAAAKWSYLLASAALAGVAWKFDYRMGLVEHVVVLAFWLVLAPLWLVKRWTLKEGLLVRLLGWLLMFPAWFAMIDWRPVPQAGLQLLALMALVWVADIAAYFAGKAFGRRKLAPAISPGKSWEGVFGAVVAVALYSVLVNHLGWVPFAISDWVLLPVAVALTAVSIVGDLLESWFKRSAGIKDSSGLLPGHGGVYDRIDSLIAVLAVANALSVLVRF